MFTALNEMQKAVIEELVNNQAATLDFINDMIVMRNFEPIKYVVQNYKHKFDAELHAELDKLVVDIAKVEIEDAMYEREHAVIH